MIKKRAVIGRTLGESPFSGNNNTIVGTASDNTHRFTLVTGRKVIFQTVNIAADKLEERTYVDPLVNGRDQTALTKESLADIIRTLSFQQFFPVIGRQVDDRIEILDGSRRRAAALICGVGLRIMYTKSEMTVEEACQLAADIQTAKEHNIREIGLRLLAMREQGLNQKEIAERENLSQAKVTRAIQAASVPAILLRVFPDQSEITAQDYKKLYSVSQLAEKKQLDIDALVDAIAVKAEEIKGQSLLSDIYKEQVLKFYETTVVTLINKPRPEKATVEILKKYDDSRVYARRKSDYKDRKYTYEFCRISKEAQDKIDEAIRSIINQYD